MRLAIGLGSSLGPRRARLERTVRELARVPGLELLRVSRWVRTPPMSGGSARGWFLNGVALFECGLPLERVLVRCRALEDAAGRRRGHHWGDRSLDLDLLLAEGRVHHSPSLTLPHPDIAARPFVVGPLLEVWPHAHDPHSGQPYRLDQARPPRAVRCGVFARPVTMLYP